MLLDTDCAEITPHRTLLERQTRTSCAGVLLSVQHTALIGIAQVCAFLAQKDAPSNPIKLGCCSKTSVPGNEPGTE